MRRKDFWLLSTVTKLLKEFIKRLSHDADGLIFQVVWNQCQCTQGFNLTYIISLFSLSARLFGGKKIILTAY